MLKLTGKDRRLVEEMRRFGILREIKSQRLDLGRGVVLCRCSDGDQFYDAFNHHVGIHVSQGRRDPRIHVLAWNGGPLLLAGGADPDYNDDARFALRQIEEACMLKEISTVLLEPHIVCGIASARGMNPVVVAQSLIVAQTRVKRRLRDATVPLFCQVDWGEMKQRTYFFSEEHFAKKSDYLAELAEA